MLRPSIKIVVPTLFALLLATPSLAQVATPVPDPLPNCPAFEDQPDAQRLAYYMGEGYAYRTANRMYEAGNAFSCVIRLIDSRYTAAYMGRGEVFIQTHDLQRAVEDFTRAGQLDTTLAEAWNNRGVAYMQMGEYTRAGADFETALSLNAMLLPAINNRALLLALQGNFSEAISVVENAIDRTGIGAQLAYVTNPNRDPDAPGVAIPTPQAALYGLLGTLRSAQALDDYRAYQALYNYSGANMDERVVSAASALESRLTFDFRLDDGSLLQIAPYPINQG